jgi:hypothetical protein
MSELAFGSRPGFFLGGATSASELSNVTSDLHFVD